MNSYLRDRKTANNEFADPQKNISFVKRRVDGKGGTHVHEFFELEFVLDGEGEQNLNGSVYKLERGSFYLLTPIDFHSISSEKGVVVANISFQQTVISEERQMQFINRRHNLFCNLLGEEKSHIETIINMFGVEFTKDSPESADMLTHLLEILLTVITRNANTDKPLNTDGIQKSLQYIFRHFREELSLETVAEKGGYSPTYFSSLFHKETGKCLSDFINDLRIHYAKLLLRSTTLSVTEICHKSGFKSVSNFFRVFSQDGLTPKEYRKNSKSI